MGQRLVDSSVFSLLLRTSKLLFDFCGCELFQKSRKCPQLALSTVSAFCLLFSIARALFLSD
jgi:hypothetical protein